MALSSADCTALMQASSPCSAQVVMIELKPMSLPPMVMLTRVVLADSDDSCELFTSVVVAPEQAAIVYEAGLFCAAHNPA